MSEKITTTLRSIIDEFSLEAIFLPKDANEILIDRQEVKENEHKFGRSRTAR